MDLADVSYTLMRCTWHTDCETNQGY